MKKRYNFLLSTPLAKHWKNIGIKKRAGITVPLFFIFSKKSIGIGEIPDFKILIEWCKKTKNKILQTLPLNDIGFNSSPFNSQSYFALDPAYLSLRELKNIENKGLEKELKILAEKFPANSERMDYRIKEEKLKKLWDIFLKRADLDSKDFKKFIKKNNYWLKDYSLYRTLKEKNKEKSWENWPEFFKNRKAKAIESFKKNNSLKIAFYEWIQWQLFEQMKEVKDYAKKRRVFLKGDLPWLVSRDSADVWARRKYFDLNFSSGSPPDKFSNKGQRWGTCPFKQKKISADNFSYFKKKLEYAENFYDLFRIDHAVGLFRIWKIPISEPFKSRGKKGFFDPKKEALWEKNGKDFLLKIIENTKMLACAEDLGTVPRCCPKVLKELGMPGLSIQRWTRNWDKDEFKKPKEYPLLSVATLSTHDTPNFPDWWENEARKKEKESLLKIIFKKEKSKEKEIFYKNLETINASASIFCIIPLLEWLFIYKVLNKKPKDYRFNSPGTISKKNWSLKMPIFLEDLLKNPANSKVRRIIEKTERG